MKKLNSSEIKKIVYGLSLSDASIRGGRFDLFTKSEELADNVCEVLNQITRVTASYKRKEDKRSENYFGYRVTSNTNEYFVKMGKEIYNERKFLSNSVAKKLNEVSLAYMWMADGYLKHAKNVTANKIQNIGFFCFERFPKEELVFLQNKLIQYEVESSLINVQWGLGSRIKITGNSLQKFISIIYPHIINDFKYKTNLYYKNIPDVNLLNTEHIFKLYENVEDIVRHSW